ncbi:lysine--tRNA ligase [Patescibacteria group bacterium]|nr:lysine--tRNA ligase [Patescibacteria group bacterium]
MFWADRVANEIKSFSKSKEQHVNDAKTPSGRIHAGSLRGVLIHDFVYKSLLDIGVKSHYTFGIDDFDPMDSLPSYLPEEKYKKHMGKPLKDIPAPDGEGSYSEYYANDFIKVFNGLGAKPEIIWSSKLYKSGKFDGAIKIALDNSEKIQYIYHKVSGSKKENNWLPFLPVCPKCGKIGTTKSFDWNGKEVEFECSQNMVQWATGCGYKGKISPFGGSGKMPYKVEWAAKWFSLRVTVEGAGKDHSSKGGTRDVSSQIAKEIYKYDPPQDIPYEFFLFGGKKMSSSKGVGASAAEVSEMLPPSVLRFLMARVQPKVALDFDPGDINTVPSLFDEFDRGQKAYFDKGDEDLADTWRASQVEEPMNNFNLRFNQVVNFVQIPGVNLEKEAEVAKGLELTEGDKNNLEERAKYAKIWLERFAPVDVKFKIAKSPPKEIQKLSESQKKFLAKLADLVDKNKDPEKFQNDIYQLGKSAHLSASDTFKAIYIVLLGKDYGPKAGSLVLAIDLEFVKNRFKEVSGGR